MTENQTRLQLLLKPLFEVGRRKREMKPATKAEIAKFVSTAVARDVPSEVILQLVEFYEVTNGIPCLNSFDFHRCDDEILYEWWSDRQLWLGQRDFYVLRWVRISAKVNSEIGAT